MHLTRLHFLPKLLQLVAQVECRLVAAAQILLQGAMENASKVPWQLGLDLGHPGWRIADDRGHHRDRTVALEGPRTGGHLVQDDPEGEDVGARVDGLSLQLLRRHVRDCSHHHAARCHRLGRQLGGPFVTLSGELGETEVEDLHLPLGGHHDVARLEIPMDDAPAVGRHQ